MDASFEKFISSYLKSSFKVTFAVIFLKIIGISKASWLLATCLLWFPIAIFIPIISIFSIAIYLGFLLVSFSDMMYESFVQMRNCKYFYHEHKE